MHNWGDLEQQQTCLYTKSQPHVILSLTGVKLSHSNVRLHLLLLILQELLLLVVLDLLDLLQLL